MSTMDSTMSEDQQKVSPRKSALIQGRYFSNPLPVYSSESSSSDSYETDDETDSALAPLGRMSRAVSRRSKRVSRDVSRGSVMSIDYEYETDSDTSASAPLPKKEEPSETERGLHDLGEDEYLKPLSDEFPEYTKPIAGDSQHSEYETDYSDSYEPDDDPEPTVHVPKQARALRVSFEESKRAPQDPDAVDAAKTPPTQEASSQIHDLQGELETWKASAHKLAVELKQKASEIQNQEDLRFRLSVLESDKASSEDTIHQLGNKVAELQQLLDNEKAEHQQTKSQANSSGHSRSSSAIPESVSDRDSIIHNALTFFTSPAKSDKSQVAVLKQEILEAREVITALDKEMTKLDTSSRNTIKEKDSVIDALETKIQELLESQKVLKQQHEAKDALLTRKDALLKQKDEEIASLKEVIRKKDLALQSHVEEAKQEQRAAKNVNPKSWEETTSETIPVPPPPRTSSPSVMIGSWIAKLTKSLPESESSDRSESDSHSQEQKPLDQLQSGTEKATSPPRTKTNRDKPQQETLEDLEEELDTLRTRVQDMMTETVSLSELLDQKDILLRDTTRKLERLQEENTKLKKMKDLVSMEGGELIQANLQTAHQQSQSSTARELMIAALQAELEVEKLRREELEEMVKDGNDSSSSVSISDDESPDPKNATNPDEKPVTSATGATAKGSRTKSRAVSKDTSKDKSAQKGEDDEDSLIGAVGTRVFGQEAKSDDGRMLQYAEEISDLKYLIRKRDEGIEILREKLQEQESLISLLNKTLSTKDLKIDRLERIIDRHHDRKTGHSISKVLEENEMTMDSLVLYRFETEQQIAKLKHQIRELEDQTRESKETEYQLRRRTEELSSAESHIRRLKAELKSENQHQSHLMEQHQQQLGRVTEEKMRLEYAYSRQSEEFQDKLREKEDFIHSIHSEATEKGLLIDSLEASLNEASRRLVQLESKVAQQNKQATVLTAQLDQKNQEQSQWKREQEEKNELIQMLHESRLEGERIIAELTKETSRQKRMRRYNTNKVSGLADAYMEPFVLDLHQAQVQYEKARKHLRLAQARERLIRPPAHDGEED